MKDNKCIAIICAMNKEVQAIINILGEVTLLEIDSHLFYVGKYQNKKIVVCESGIGKVNAAIITTLMIKEFKPTYLINSGVAGGYDKGLKTLDVVIGDKMLYYDVDVTFGMPSLRFGQMQGEPFTFSSDKKLIDIIKTANLPINIKIGQIITADCFQTDRVYLDSLKNKYFNDLDILAVDMESTSIAHTCYKFKIPFIIIRSISDVVGINQEQTYDNFLERACHNSSIVTQKLLEKI